MKRYEYLTDSLFVENVEEKKFLKIKGEEGWKLIIVIMVEKNVFKYYFKREIK